MALSKAIPPDEMRVILCIKFDRRASFDEVAAFKQTLNGSDHVRHSVEVSGTFDMMVEVGLPDFAAYQALLEHFAEPLAKLVERQDANFVCGRYVRAHERGDSIWVPTRDGRKRVELAQIDFIQAEGDYVQIHSGSNTWLFHSTMRNLREQLDPARFLTLHRSVIVNADFILKLVHRSNHWIALLGNGNEQRIAKSHVAEVLAQLRTDLNHAPPQVPTEPGASHA